MRRGLAKPDRDQRGGQQHLRRTRAGDTPFGALNAILAWGTATSSWLWGAHDIGLVHSVRQNERRETYTGWRNARLREIRTRRRSKGHNGALMCLRCFVVQDARYNIPASDCKDIMDSFSCLPSFPCHAGTWYTCRNTRLRQCQYGSCRRGRLVGHPFILPASPKQPSSPDDLPPRGGIRLRWLVAPQSPASAPFRPERRMSN